MTVPECFELASQRRHREAVELKQEKLKLQELMEQKKREFKAKQVPDYENLEMCVMPSAKPTTVAMKPAFASDYLTKKGVHMPEKK